MREKIQQVRPVFRQISDLHISVYAGNATFYLIISLFPAIMLLLALLQYTPVTAADLIDAISGAIPSPLEPLVDYLLSDLYSAGSAITIISVTAVSGVWLASRSVMGVLYGLNAVYQVKETRNFFHLRLIAVVYMVALMIALVLTLVLHVFGQRLQALLTAQIPFLGEVFSAALSLRVLVLIGLLTLVFTSCFMALPNRKSRLRSAVPGALLAAVGWVVFSSIFSFYLNYFSNYSLFFGSLTTFVVALLWLFFCMNILFYGALCNVWLEPLWAHRTERRAMRTVQQEAKPPQEGQTEEQAGER